MFKWTKSRLFIFCYFKIVFSYFVHYPYQKKQTQALLESNLLGVFWWTIKYHIGWILLILTDILEFSCLKKLIDKFLLSIFKLLWFWSLFFKSEKCRFCLYHLSWAHLRSFPSMARIVQPSYPKNFLYLYISIIR